VPGVHGEKSETMTFPRAMPLLLIPLLAACTATAAPAAQTSPSPSADLSVHRELVRCLRANGVPNFPDPTVNAQGEVQLGGPNTRVPQSAETACRSIFNRLPPGSGEKPLTAAELAQLKKLAQCFRQHGVTDWPDPDTRGIFHLNARLDQLGKRAWLPAREACKQYFVGNKMRATGPDGKKGKQ
jgi:hypothetical protein